MKIGRLKIFGVALLALAGTSMTALSQELVIWHDKGDDGIKMFQEIGAEFAKTNPGVTVKSLSFPTEQWFSRSIAAINTGTSPDLIFNDNFRIARIQQSTSKLHDFGPGLDKLGKSERSALSASDLDASRYNGKLVMLPTQRILVGLGARTSWLKEVGEPFPKTWADALRVAAKFQSADPDKNGKADTYGFASQAGDASVLHQMLEFFGFGAGLKHILVDDKGEIVLDQPQNAKMVSEHLKLMAEYKLVAPETPNHTFTDMYQLIEGRRAGFFRVGDWNVRKWDREGLKGDYEIGPLPVLFEGNAPRLVVHGMRSAGVPTNGKKPDLAVRFAEFMLTPEAQAASLRNMGSAMRTDVPTEGLPEHLLFFAKTKLEIAPNDFPESLHSWYPQFKEIAYRELMAAVSKPPADWNVWAKDTAAKLRVSLADLKKKS